MPSTTNFQKARTPAADPKPIHQPFSWLHHAAKIDADANFATTVFDVSRGIKTVASILQNHLIDLNAIASGASVHPLMSESDIESLAGLMTWSLGVMCELAEMSIDRINVVEGVQA